MKTEERRERLWLLLGGAVGLAALVGTVMLVLSLMKPTETKRKRAVTEITLQKPPPPPPQPKDKPPPPKEEVKEKLDVPKPQATPAPANPAPQATPPAGLADGPAGGMQTDMARGDPGLIGKPASVGGGGTSRFAWYGAMVKERIQEAIQKDKRLQSSGEFKLMVNVWIGAAGEITAVKLLGTTNDADLDAMVEAAIKRLPPLREGAPGDMPQPVKLRITSR